ncbi:MAG: HAMP domain-containing sensor histidine kinase [Agathobacter sp.]|nr:HAMP domain-containing sensor histidine kinase [Agathobacter sp.]
MKIRTKLILAFCVVILVPACLMVFITIGIFGSQNNLIMNENRNIKNAEKFWLNSDEIYSASSSMDEYYWKIDSEIKKKPDKNSFLQYCYSMEQEINKKGISLFVKKDDQIVFGGSNDSDIRQKMLNLPRKQPDKYIEILDNDIESFYRIAGFEYEDGTRGTICMVKKIPRMIDSRIIVLEVSAVVIVILILTACLMILWIYRSMISPIKKLQVAVQHIKDGNLDFAIEPVGSDEIAKLCATFEEMRQRLRDNVAEKVENENENRALISNIAHDLKTPITAVKGYSEGILDGVANTPEKIDKYVRTIYNKANEMDTLINELTLYTKYDTNRIPYNFAKIGVGEYFDDCVAEIVVDLEEKDIGLAYNNYVEDDVIIIVDPEQLRRVINNIISNSVKYMDRQEGFVNIRIKDVGEFVQVEIEDNGKGIEQKSLPYIFDRFYRADASRNSATGGSGIGLSIVKKIIEDHGGKIWATSKEGEGTTMYFVIHKFQEVEDENE